MEAERGLAARGQDTRGATELRRIAGQSRSGPSSPAGPATPCPSISPPEGRGPPRRPGGLPGAGPAPLRPGQSAPERRIQRRTEAWAVARPRGVLAPGVPLAPKAPGPARHPQGPLEKRRGRNAAEDVQGCLRSPALSLLPAAGSGDLRQGRAGRTVVCVRCADQEKRMNGFQNRADLWGLAMGNRGYL